MAQPLHHSFLPLLLFLPILLPTASSYVLPSCGNQQTVPITLEEDSLLVLPYEFFNTTVQIVFDGDGNATTRVQFPLLFILNVFIRLEANGRFFIIGGCV